MFASLEKLHFKLKREKFHPIYILSGEYNILSETCYNIILALSKKEKTIHKIYHLDSTPIDLFWEDLAIPSLFFDKIIFELRCKNLNLTKKPVLDLCDKFIRKVIPNRTVIILAENIDKNLLKNSSFIRLNRFYFELPFIKKNNMSKWITIECQRRKMNLAKDLIEYLTTKVEGNIVAAKQELNLLHLIFEDQPITLVQVIDTIFDNSYFTIFDLRESLISRNLTRYLNVLSYLARTDVEKLLILWIIQKTIRNLLSTLVDFKNNISLAKSMAKNGFWPKQQACISDWIRGGNEKFLINLLVRGLECDKIIKGLREGNIWLEFGKIGLDVAINIK